MFAASHNFYERGPKFDTVQFENERKPYYLKMEVLFSMKIVDDVQDFVYPNKNKKFTHFFNFDCIYIRTVVA